MESLGMSPITFRPGQLVKISRPTGTNHIGVEAWIIAADGFNTDGYTVVPFGTVALYVDLRTPDSDKRTFHRLLIGEQLVFVNDEHVSHLKEP